jgi:hypothetical protein
LRHEVPVLFRVKGTQDWSEGTTENVSKSGLLFRSPSSFEPQTKLELKLQMPKELTGDTPAEVVCQATVRRVVENPATKKHPATFNIACAVAGYDFQTLNPRPQEAPEKAKAPESASSQSANVVEFMKRQRRVH